MPCMTDKDHTATASPLVVLLFRPRLAIIATAHRSSATSLAPLILNFLNWRSSQLAICSGSLILMPSLFT